MEASDPKNWNFEPVEATVDPSTLTRRTEACVIQTTGHTLLNANGADTWNNVVRTAGLPLETTLVRFEANVARKLIAAYPVPMGLPDVKGVGPVRRYAGRRSVSMHLGGVFKHYSALRPVTQCEALVSQQVDSQGRPFMLIDLGAAILKRSERTVQET
ncbi:MAG TPA: hypothetical protein VD902_05050 [Symbiobacteriaceae bacterium]|nr:hypothetical protein [Symbiobacteriaceae bacterium]